MSSGVKQAVEDCRNAGVDMKMITGENVFTAKAIATYCGILHLDDDHDESVILGVDFRNYTEEEQMAKVNKIRVMARSSPSDKLLMVQCLKEKGYVVAVTGGGTNDAPALIEADIGLSMGIQGTDMAKESSDIVILDENFASIVAVLKWGRCISNNIHKLIQFQLTSNVAALGISFVAAVSGNDVPLSIIELLWVNLVMNTLGALALAMEKPSKELLEKRVEGRSEPLISNVMWRDLLAQALYQMFIHLILEFVNETLIFNVFVLFQIFNLINARNVEKKNVFEGIEKDKLFVGIIGITLVLQVVMVELMNKIADTERLNLWEWGLCIGIAAASWLVAFFVKFIPVPEKPFFSNFGEREIVGGSIEHEVGDSGETEETADEGVELELAGESESVTQGLVLELVEFGEQKKLQ